ncbi:MAG TPA: D-2-hydroxyacid dehydrogenase [Firmicutes bacterium]|jgi:D-2-hydroxyacid dehydrogenase (NADP+)|nr:D-2-hydroxyacid dehydrogenase [Bacillota bacterium]
MILSLQLPFGREFLQIIEKKIGEKIHAYDHIQDAAAVLPEAEVIMLMGSIDPVTIKTCRRLKWLFSFSAGVEKLPFKELMEMGVRVTNTRGIHGPQIAEQTMGMMISFSRGLNRSYRNQLEQKWDQFMTVDELTGKTLCIIGAGSIGREIARKAKAFDLTVIGLKTHPEPMENFDQVWGIAKLHEALGLADYTVLITPLTDQTYHLMGRAEFEAMKKSGIFINVSRGDTVDETALIEALQKGLIAGAGLDVFHEEPLPPTHSLWKMNNVIITPHNSGISPKMLERASSIFMEGWTCYRQGRPLPNPVNLQRKY